MSTTPRASETVGGTVAEPTPAAAHPSTAQIRWSWRYQLWPAAVIAALFTLLGVVGIVVVLVRGPGPAGSTYLTRAGTVAVENGSWFDALVPYLGPAIGGLFVAALVFTGRRGAASVASWPITPGPAGTPPCSRSRCPTVNPTRTRS